MEMTERIPVPEEQQKWPNLNTADGKKQQQSLSGLCDYNKRSNVCVTGGQGGKEKELESIWGASGWLSLGFSSGWDLRVVGLCTGRGACLGFSIPLPFPPLSLSQINILKIQNKIKKIKAEYSDTLLVQLGHSNDSKSVFGNHKCWQDMAQFSCNGRQELSTQNSLSSKHRLQERTWNQDICR